MAHFETFFLQQSNTVYCSHSQKDKHPKVQRGWKKQKQSTVHLSTHLPTAGHLNKLWPTTRRVKISFLSKQDEAASTNLSATCCVRLNSNNSNTQSVQKNRPYVTFSVKKEYNMGKKKLHYLYLAYGYFLFSHSSTCSYISALQLDFQHTP